MKRMYTVDFTNDATGDAISVYNSEQTTFPTWQRAYRYARAKLCDFAHGDYDPITLARVTGFMPDGRSGILAEFWIPEPNGVVLRRA